ncbi:MULTISPECIES: type IV pilin biogenesis protein [Acidithiobacillus]|uniref:type IV pilin biogenesis protein n=1 Tax=Acidithiobacillus TaxID=119977 RepID=UPI0029C2F1E2|nr:type IV pilin biogenesis protein [Acidithiobacillus thiooxidans]MDX5935373.1 type IV pilin biogenesis protein [Acidithiobacillus thiooxidans]
MKKKLSQKFLVSVLCLSMSAAPLVSWSSFAQANTITILPANQPQVMILLDNSQGMAGVLQGPTGLSGAIMTGSGWGSSNPNSSNYNENLSSSSPVAYTASGFTPPALGSKGASALYSVPCNTSGITAAAQSACKAVGASTSSNTSSSSTNYGYIDNSQSMLNVAEQAIGTIINTPEYNNNIQFGLMDYALSGNVSLYNTWVYYMSDNNGFSFGTSATGAPSGDIAVNNPCYGSVSNGYFTNNSCAKIYNLGYNNLSVSGLYNDNYLYVNASSDAPIINDVMYATGYGGAGSGSTNAVGVNPTLNNMSLPDYEQLAIGGYTASTPYVTYYPYTSRLASNMAPTSAGYISQSYQQWLSQRGYAFNASTSYNNGNIVSYISATNSTNATNIAKAILPEVFLPNNGSFNYASNGPITASAGYSPMAGAFSTALNYYEGKLKKQPPTTCGSKYVIFITDGQPTQGMNNGYVYPPLGSASAQMFGVTSITASTWSSTNNNAVVEAIQEIQALAQQGIKTYVLGVGSAVNPNVPGASAADQAVALQGQAVLTAMAQAGGTTNFYAATSASDVQSAMNSIIANILGKSVSASYGAPPSATVGSLEFLLKDVNPITGQGDLYAYALQSNGTPSVSASWDANTYMNIKNRTSVLYTTTPGGTNGAGTEISLTSVATNTPSAFGTLPTSLTAGTIAAYTINPSASGGAYLGGRQSGWYMGLPTSTPPQVLTAPNNGQLLGAGGTTNSYLKFAQLHASRQNAVLFSDNDGFLYAMGYNNTGSPTLLWGWMPQGLLPQLQNYNTFWQGVSMQGGFQTVDATVAPTTNSHTWHTYVAGSASNGSILYDLQLTGTGTAGPDLSQTVWEDDLGENYSQPQPSNPVFYQYQTPGTTSFGQTWALWAVNKAISATSSTSYLIGVNVGTGQSFQDSLPFNNTATPYIDASGNLYLGDNTGNIYEISTATLPGLLTPGAATLTLAKDFVNNAAIGNYSSAWSGSLSGSNPGEVQYIGGSYYQGKNYLRVQGPNGITIFSQLNGTWLPVWSAYAGGAGIWSSGAFTTQTSSANPPITALPAGSVVSAPALINSGAVILPVTVPPSANTCGNSNAYYYLYALNNGIFPSGTFTNSTGVAITSALFVGYGTAFTPTVSSFNGRTLLQGSANNTGPTKMFPTGFGAGLPLGGPTGWKLVN